MASTAGDTLPSYSAFLDNDHHHPLYLDHPSAAASFPAAAAQEPNQHPPPAAEARKPRKRARASRRPPTTVLTADASNFRAMVQEFTGFPAPLPPFAAPHLIGAGAGALFGAGPSPSAAPAFHQLLRPSPLKLSAAAAPHTSSFANTLFASSNAYPTAAAAAAPSLSSELYSRFGPFAGGAMPRYGNVDEGFPAMEEERAQHGHGFATSFLHAGDRYHSH